ncbi:MAG: single-stranded DNA-binding protein [Planctomycetota bacterium]
MAKGRSTTHTTGRLTRDVELRQTANGNSVANVSIAYNVWSKKDQKEVANFQDWCVWGNDAEYLSKYGKKGDWIALEGEFKTRKYEDKNGNERTQSEFWANHTSLMGGSRSGGEAQSAGKSQRGGGEGLPF